MSFSELAGIRTEIDVIEAKDGTSNTLMVAEKFTTEGGAIPAGTRLFVGNLSMNSPSYGPEVGDQVLVSFEHGQGKDTHPDFLWAPDWIL